MVAKDAPNITHSTKGVVGEIDTRAPFQSVKDAVNLFGEGAFSGSGEKPTIKKSKPHSAERVLAKETQLHLTQKELNKLKDQLKNAETTKSQAQTELEKAKRTVDDLTHKLKSVTESKESAIKATDVARDQLHQLEIATNGYPVNDSPKQDSESRREEYANAVAELDAAKKLLRQVWQDRDAIVEAKKAAIKQVGEAKDASNANIEKAVEISKEIKAVQESIGQVKLITMQAQQDQANIFSKKDDQKQLYKAILEDSTKKVLAIKKEFNPEVAINLETQLTEAVMEANSLQKEIEIAKANDIDSVKNVTLELDGAKGSLQKIVEEKSSLQKTVESLEIELEKVKKEHAELKKTEMETESLVGDLHNKLRKTKAVLETAVEEESKANSASEESISTLKQIISERENARSEAEDTKKKVEILKNEAEATRIAIEEAEKKLEVALIEAEEAKAAEKRALNRIKELSEKTNAARASFSENGAKIVISREEFEALGRKMKESNVLADLRVAAAMAQVDAIKASENEAVKKLELSQKEIEDTKAATKEALKKADMAEAAKKAVEGELRRWRERESKKADEATKRIVEERELSSEWLPHQHRVQKQMSSVGTVVVGKRFERRKTFLSKKVIMPKLSGIFRGKKREFEGVYSQSYLPGEVPM